MSDLETSIKDAWVSYIAAHGGQTASSSAEIARGAFPGHGAVTSTVSSPSGDFEKIERYIARVAAGDADFTHDVTYQLYYVTECLIWLWKRLPREFLVRDEGRNEQDRKIEALLRDLNAGTKIENLTNAEKAELAAKQQGQRATPTNGVEIIVKRGEFVGPASVREMAVTAQSHEPPPPPPGWPGD